MITYLVVLMAISGVAVSWAIFKSYGLGIAASALVLWVATFLAGLWATAGLPSTQNPGNNYVVHACLNTTAVLSSSNHPDLTRYYHYICDMKEREMIKGGTAVARNKGDNQGKEGDATADMEGDYLLYNITPPKGTN